MKRIRIRSVSAPLAHPKIAGRAIETFRRAEAMGLLSRDDDIEELDETTFRRVADRIEGEGIGSASLYDLKRELGQTDSDVLADRLEELNEVLVQTPAPSKEWPRLTELFDVDQLSRLLGVSAASLRRYRKSSRPTPDEVAARLHFLALLVGDLAGAYNDIGVRRWFDRKRTALDGRSPGEILKGEWTPDDQDATRVRDLARSLVGASAT